MSSRFELGRKGSVAVWIALMIPVLTMALAFGVEVGGREAVRMSTQRTADVSANAGAMNYEDSLNGQGSLAEAPSDYGVNASNVGSYPFRPRKASGTVYCANGRLDPSGNSGNGVVSQPPISCTLKRSACRIRLARRVRQSQWPAAAILMH
jgi:uncharacterized membrane protein